MPGNSKYLINGSWLLNKIREVSKESKIKRGFILFAFLVCVYVCVVSTPYVTFLVFPLRSEDDHRNDDIVY